MQKKGDLLNQLAIISDLIEKMNIESKSQTVFVELNQNEFERVYELVQKKYNKSNIEAKNNFNIRIGKVDIFFSKNNV